MDKHNVIIALLPVVLYGTTSADSRGTIQLTSKSQWVIFQVLLGLATIRDCCINDSRYFGIPKQ